MRIALLAPLLVIATLAGTAPAQLVFAPPLESYGGNYTNRAVVGDLDEDGWPDVVTGHATLPGGPKLCFGLGTGLFGPIQPITAVTGRAVSRLADFNADGHLDLVTFGSDGPGPHVLLLLGDGAGGFPTTIMVGSSGLPPADVAAGDFDADGRLDLAVYNWPLFPPTIGSIAVVLGHGDGSFGAPVTVATVTYFETGGSAGMLRAGDTNGDGFDDLVYTTVTATPTLLSQGNGSFVLAPCTACESVVDRDFVLADVNADGRADLVTSARVMLAEPGGSFGPGQVYSLAGMPLSVAVADLDGDGPLDIVVGRAWTANYTDPTKTTGDVFIARGNGDGTFQMPPLVVSNVPLPHDVVIADLDVDGRPDVLAADLQDQAASLRGLLNATYGPGSPFLDLGGVLPGSNGAPIQLAAGTLVAGQPFSFALDNGPPNGVAFDLVGFSLLGAPFKGGLMIPFPNLVLGPLPLDGNGHITLAGTSPNGASGLTLYLQFWMPTGGGPAGFVASSGVRAQIP